MSQTLKHSKKPVLTVVALAAALAVGAACGGGESGPAQGTPAWYFQAAGDNFAIPEYGKTVEQLNEAAKAEGEMGRDAILWRAAVTAGLARGYDTLADAFATGIEANEARTEDFQNSVNDYRRRTRVNAIEFSEGIGELKKIIDAGEAVPLNFPLPPGNDSVSPILTSVENGNKVDAQITAMEDQTLTRGIFSVLGDWTGGADLAKLQADASAGTLQAPSDAMSFGVARILLDISVMFDRDGINDPRVRKFVYEKAVEWAEPHMENEDLGDRLEDFKFDVENEKRDMEGKRRMKKPEDD